MRKIKQVLYIAREGFRKWHRNSTIILCFLLAFIFCFLLSDKVMQFAQTYDTHLQGLEAFIWTFGDSQSVLAISILLLLLFSDMPNLSNEVPYFIVRTDRRTWMCGQILYLVSATFVFLLFIFAATIFCPQAGHIRQTSGVIRQLFWDIRIQERNLLFPLLLK